MLVDQSLLSAVSDLVRGICQGRIQTFQEPGGEPLQDGPWDGVLTGEGQEIYGKTRIDKQIAEGCGTGIWQNRILLTVALQNRNRLAVFQLRCPDRFSQQIT